MNTCYAWAISPCRFRILPSIPRMIAPSNEPMTPPSPPKRLVPPMTTAQMLLKFRSRRHQGVGRVHTSGQYHSSHRCQQPTESIHHNVGALNTDRFRPTGPRYELAKDLYANASAQFTAQYTRRPPREQHPSHTPCHPKRGKVSRALSHRESPSGSGVSRTPGAAGPP